MEVGLKCKEETLYEYLVRQKFERELTIDEYKIAKAAYEDAKAKFESYGDMSVVEKEIEQLEGYIEQVKPKPIIAEQMSCVVDEQPTQTVVTSCSDDVEA